MSVYLIAAISENKVIGKDGKLPWRLPLDLKWFKMNTSAGAVIMGRKTWDSLPKKPLPNRLNIILSHQPKQSQGDTLWCTSFQEAMCKACSRTRRIYIIGGAEIYRIAIPYVNILILTRVHDHVEGQDLKYMVLPERKKLIWTSALQKHKGTSFHFEIYLKQ